MSDAEDLFVEAMEHFERGMYRSQDQEIRELAKGLQQLAKALLEQHREFDNKLSRAECGV